MPLKGEGDKESTSTSTKGPPRLTVSELSLTFTLIIILAEPGQENYHSSYNLKYQVEDRYTSKSYSS